MKNTESQTQRLWRFFVQNQMTWFRSDEIVDIVGIKHIRTKMHTLRHDKRSSFRIISYREHGVGGRSRYAAIGKDYGIDVEFCLMNGIRKKIARINNGEQLTVGVGGDVYEEPLRIKDKKTIIVSPKQLEQKFNTNNDSLCSDINTIKAESFIRNTLKWIKKKLGL